MLKVPAYQNINFVDSSSCNVPTIIGACLANYFFA